MLNQMLKQVNLYCDSLLTFTIQSLFYRDPVYNRSINTQDSQMTNWAIQPSHWGNEVKIGAEFRSNFASAEDTALDMATEYADSMCIFKVGTKADIKWMEVN
tara:strand:- start:7 stop:312 length:306 start_codon:yes stop_codon:yes gene_type:complete